MTNQEKEPQKGRRLRTPKSPHGPSIWMQLAIAFVVFLVLSTGYSLVREYIAPTSESVPLSQIAVDIQEGNIVSITVEGDNVTATYNDETTKTSRKETEASFTETLKNYNISEDKIAAVKIEIKDEGGVRFWFLTLAPLILPIVLLFGIIWFLSRQMRGAGMQAFTFGRSLARLISPEDHAQRVTFADVAGAKEAKEELMEIVDFLKNPKKFIKIGARIPKGVILMGAPGTGKCVVGETQVLTAKGLVAIQDIPQFFTVNGEHEVEGLRICSVDPNTLELRSARASHWCDLGEQPTVRLSSDLGITIEGTHEHPIVVVDEKTGQFVFRRLDEIRAGEYAVVTYDTNFFGPYTRIPHPDVAYLLGVIVGDGCMTTKNRLAFTSADKEIVEHVQTITRVYFGAEWRKTNSRPYDYEIINGDIKRRIISYGLSEVGAEHKHVPMWVKIAPREYVTAFLRGLFDTDGYVEKHGAIGLSSASRELIEEVHAMLLNIGIVSRIYSRTKRHNGHLQHYITVYGDFLEAFQQKIGFTVARKQDRLTLLIDRQRNTNINVIPHQGALISGLWNEMRALTTIKLDRAFYGRPLYKNIKRYISGERKPSLLGMQTFIAGVTGLAPAIASSQSINFLQRISSGNYFFTKITEKRTGRARVFDLTVPQSHNFIANGLVNHNTLLARAVAGEAGVPFFSISGSEFVEMFVGVGASVSGDTPVLVRSEDGVRLTSIASVVDRYYREDESNHVKKVSGLQTLGFKPLNSGFRGESEEGKQFFGGSAWTNVQSVYRHKADSLYVITYLGGEIKTTGDHSIFVRSRNMIVEKKASELKKGDVLVNLPFRVRGAYIPGIGTLHSTRAHQFDRKAPAVLDIYGEDEMKARDAHAFAIANKDVMTQKAVAAHVGVRQMTISNWQRGIHGPRLLASPVIGIVPRQVESSPELMRLVGYYAAEGRTTRHHTQFVFGLHEKSLHDDCASLIRTLLRLEPSLTPVPDTNSMRITLYSAVVARFFERQCGTGSKNKHIPEHLWTASKEEFLAFLEGYSRGDGHHTAEGKLSITSVSYQMIRELAWLCAMHGIQAGVRQTYAPARIIRAGGKTVAASISWNLIIGKSANPFRRYIGTVDQFKRPVVRSVKKIPYGGYVYDLCGCDNEAFFGGEKPLLLHNSRVRDLFETAKKTAPAIVFIDEIDAVGRVRGTGVGGGNDEREQTLNQILVEMDGFEPNEKVIVMAATNRPDVLDPALLRPGRFDRRVTIDLPDRKDREEILKVHARQKPLGPDVKLQVIAERTPGFSGADLGNLMNEGAILAARENRRELTQFDLIRSIEKVMLGPERRSHVLNKKEKEITAYHEAGHALISSVLSYADPVHKISIISRGRAAGYTLKLPFEDKKMQSRKEFLDDIAVSLGGYVAEKMVFDDVTTGAANDLQVLTALARDMVTRYGMSEKMGTVAYDIARGRTLFGAGIESGEISQEVAAQIDAEVKHIIDAAHKKAESVLKKYRKALDAIAKKLIEVETIERDEFEKILIAHGITPKKKEDIEHQPLV